MFLTQHTSAQSCTNYPIFWSLEGFNCTADEGRVCFNTDPLSWAPLDHQCIDYHFRITFPTGGFDYEFVGILPSMMLVSETPIETVLRFNHFGNQDGMPIAECLDITVLDPNAAFTVEIVSDDDPNLIINTATVAIDLGTTIGDSPSSETLLSVAVAQGDLLSAEDADNMGQIVTINGTLIIDVDGLDDTGEYQFGFPNNGFNVSGPVNTIYMGQNARIEVQDEAILDLNWGSISSCEDTWDRIEIQDGGGMTASRFRISDAVVGTELRNNAALTIFRGVNYIDNITGIGSFGNQMKDIELNIFSSIFFLSSINGGGRGMHFENVNMVDILGNMVIKNQKSDGIYLDNTNFISSNGIIIEKCQRAGVWVETPSNLFSLNFPYISQCRFGVYTKGNNDFLINQGYFWRNETAVYRNTSIPNEFTSITNSTFVQGRIDIYGSLLTSEGIIENNSFSQSRNNIILRGIGNQAQHNWRIQNNPIMGSLGTNIFLSGIFGAEVRENPQMVANGFNFLTRGGNSNRYFFNVATSNGTSFSINNSTQPRIFCNDFTGATGMHFFNNNGGALILGNEMFGSNGDGNFNLMYGSEQNTFAQTSVQPFRGNMFESSNFFNPKAKNFSENIQQTLLSRYLIGPSNVTQGTSTYPFFEAATTQWMLPASGTNSGCPEQEPPLPNDDEERLRAAITTNIGLLENGIKDIYGEELNFNTELKLLRQLKQLEAVSVLEATEQDWLDLLESTEKEAMLDVEQTISTATKYDEAADVASKQTREALRNELAELHELVWYEIVGNEVIIDEDKKQYRDNLKVQIQAKLSDIKAINDTQSAELQIELSPLTVLNEDIVTEGISPAKNLIAVNDLLIKRLGDDFGGYYNQELQLLEQIANQCLVKGGESVLTARSLLMEVTREFVEYNDECLVENNAQYFVANTNSDELSDIQLSPNPAKDRLKITLPAEVDYNTLEVINSYGRVLQKITIGEYDTEINYSTSHLPNGLYIIKPNNSSNQGTKFLISH